jgi:hypothetical protein
LNLIIETIKNLNRRGFITESFKNIADVKNRVYQNIKGRTVGISSSMTLEKLGIIKESIEYAKKVYIHRPGNHGEIERKALVSDVFLTSANAVSKDGHIVNIDGTGNRVSATCFGPKLIIYVIGINKITYSLEEAHKRAKSTAVLLAKHFNRKTPCVKTGKCSNCLANECICAITTVHRKKPYGIDIKIFIVNEELGL